MRESGFRRTHGTTPRSTSGSRTQGSRAARPGDRPTPMQRKPIDFRILLERLLPTDELPPADQIRIARALQSGVPTQIEQIGLMTLQQLEDLGVLRRVAENGGDYPYRVRFQSRGVDLITLELP